MMTTSSPRNTIPTGRTRMSSWFRRARAAATPAGAAGVGVAAGTGSGVGRSTTGAEAGSTAATGGTETVGWVGDEVATVGTAYTGVGIGRTSGRVCSRVGRVAGGSAIGPSPIRRVTGT